MLGGVFAAKLGRAATGKDLIYTKLRAFPQFPELCPSNTPAVTSHHQTDRDRKDSMP